MQTITLKHKFLFFSGIIFCLLVLVWFLLRPASVLSECGVTDKTDFEISYAKIYFVEENRELTKSVFDKTERKLVYQTLKRAELVDEDSESLLGLSVPTITFFAENFQVVVKLWSSQCIKVDILPQDSKEYNPIRTLEYTLSEQDYTLLLNSEMFLQLLDYEADEWI